jgi:hypothetical protein
MNTQAQFTNSCREMQETHSQDPINYGERIVDCSPAHAWEQILRHELKSKDRKRNKVRFFRGWHTVSVQTQTAIDVEIPNPSQQVWFATVSVSNCPIMPFQYFRFDLVRRK